MKLKTRWARATRSCRPRTGATRTRRGGRRCRKAITSASTNGSKGRPRPGVPSQRLARAARSGTRPGPDVDHPGFRLDAGRPSELVGEPVAVPADEAVVGLRPTAKVTRSARARVHVHAPVADEAAKRDAAVAAELDCEGRGSADGDDDRAAGHGRLLDELEGKPAADADDLVRDGRSPSRKRPPDDLVERVVAADVLARVKKAAESVRAPWRAAAGGRERPAAKRAAGRAARRRVDGHSKAALYARRIDSDRFERAFAADPARGRRVEVPPQRVGVEALRGHLDSVRRQVLREGRLHGLDALGEQETDRELLVVARCPHGHGAARVHADPRGSSKPPRHRSVQPPGSRRTSVRPRLRRRAFI